MEDYPIFRVWCSPLEAYSVCFDMVNLESIWKERNRKLFLGTSMFVEDVILRIAK